MAAAAWAVVVAFSRCMMGRHYLSDVLAGLLLGVATLAILTQVNKIELTSSFSTAIFNFHFLSCSFLFCAAAGRV